MTDGMTVEEDAGRPRRSPGNGALTGARRRRAAIAVIVAVLTALLFIDARNPRGVLDGVGYPAVIALSLWLGRRAVLGGAMVTTVLTVIAFFLTPAGGIDLAGTLANRSFAIASIWIVAASLLRRIRLEAEVADRDAWFRSLLDQIPMPVAIHDLEDRYIHVNKVFERWAGLAEADVLGRTRAEIWAQKSWASLPLSQVDEVIRTRQPVQIEPLALRIGGETRWAMGTCFPIFDAKGGFVATGTAGSDVTELWRARDLLAAREADLRRFQTALTDAFREARLFDLPYADALRAFTEIVGRTLDVDRTSIYHADLDGDWVERVELWERSAERHHRSTFESPNLFGLFRTQFGRDRVVAIDDVGAEPRLEQHRPVLAKLDIRAILAAPIYARGQLHGNLILCQTGRTRAWSAEEKAFARSAADVVSLLFVTDRYRETLAALDLIEEGIYLQRADGRVLYANQAVSTLLGRPHSTAPQLLPLGGAPEEFPQPPLPLDSEHDRSEIAVDTASGRRELELKRHRRPCGGTVVVIDDKTRRNEDQRERERLQEQLQRAGKMEAMGLLAGGIAHDFNNLLGAISGFARFLEQDLPIGSDQYHYARRILNACRRGETVTAQILMFARSQGIASRLIDLRRVAEDSAEVLRGLMAGPTRLELDIEQQPMRLSGDEGQLVQLLVNLCTNANTALGGRSGQVRLSLLSIDQSELDLGDATMPAGEATERRTSAGWTRLALGSGDRAARYARIRVADNGSGIAAEILPKIFDPFFSAHQGSLGTGLGLAIVYRVVVAHRGAITVESALGHGSVFSIYLPLDAVGEAEIDQKPAAGPPSVASARGAERVLIVDDEHDIADMLSIGLERLGYEVAGMNDAAAALAEFRDAPDAWDVVVTDQRMPGLDGLTLVRALKSLRPEVKTILCTGAVDEAFLKQQSPDLDAFFMKPVSPEQIAAAIRALLSGERPSGPG
jgi:PAS domain S-box-containing protein